MNETTETEDAALVRCPECMVGGMTSRVYVIGGTSTLLACLPFYDEDGRYHYHDYNAHRTQYECSRGHRFGKTSHGSCWCGWKGGPGE